MGRVAKNVETIVGVATGSLPQQYRLSGITTSTFHWYAQEGRRREGRFEDTLDKTTPGKERLQVLTAQPRRSSSNNNRGILDTAVTNSRANRPRTVIMRQWIQSIFARVADFLRKKNGIDVWPSSSAAARSSMGPIGIIGLVTSDTDRRLLAGICNRNGWHLLFEGTCETARGALDRLKAPVILCDRDLPGKGWRETVEYLASSPHRPCIILVSGVVDTYLWDEVVRTGGYDILSKPLREDEVARAIRLAWSYWSSSTRTEELSDKRPALNT